MPVWEVELGRVVTTETEEVTGLRMWSGELVSGPKWTKEVRRRRASGRTRRFSMKIGLVGGKEKISVAMWEGPRKLPPLPAAARGRRAKRNRDGFISSPSAVAERVRVRMSYLEARCKPQRCYIPQVEGIISTIREAIDRGWGGDPL